MAATPLALAILGVAPVNRARDTDAVEREQLTQGRSPYAPPTRSFRRAASNYNSFQTICTPCQDDPPPYATAIRHKPEADLLPGQNATSTDDFLPRYSCTVHAEGRMLLHVESINPLHGIAEGEWREIYMVLRGTFLSLYRVKDGRPGRLLRSYTLQHAEIGLATDTQYQLLIPQTRLAHLIPAAARQKAFRKDPGKFKAVQQHMLRLRVETDQILLADACEARIFDLINVISAGIDIAPALDERSFPRQQTVPRRRRRRPRVDGDLNDPLLLAEQARILREMYPDFAEHSTSTHDNEQVVNLPTTVESGHMPAQEEDELDLAVMREEHNNATNGNTPPRPNISRQTTSSSVDYFSDTMLYDTSPANFNPSGKWEPPHPQSASQTLRYTRRCMPVLNAEAVRASDILICHGKRVKINWRMELMEEWELKPPSYKSHDFKPRATGLARLKSTSSQSPSYTGSGPRENENGPVLDNAGGDRIERADALSNLELAKSHTRDSRPHVGTKTPETMPTGGPDMPGVVFCF